MIRLALTFGDPSSIGPEVGLKAIKKFLRSYKDTQLQIFAPDIFLRKDRELNKYIQKNIIQVCDPEKVYPRLTIGKPTLSSAARALRDLERATESCLKSKSAALITGPLDKSWCAKIIPGFKGHTEYLEKKTRSKRTVMLLAGPKLRVALVTTHLPLKKVASQLRGKSIVETGILLSQFLKQQGHGSRIAVLGLNPHASDRGLIGTEEKKIITPAVNKLKTLGINVSGPHSPDSFFAKYSAWDAVICMYHDQGLIPLKMLHFYDAVNITLGLPFLRTSVDHGTAFDIAGRDRASSESYENALKTARIWVKKASRHRNTRRQRA